MTAPLELEPATPDGVQSDTPEEEAPAGDPSGQSGGWWLEEADGARVKSAVLKAWTEQDAVANRRAARAKRDALLRAGYRGVRVVADEETDRYTVRAPFGAQDAPRAPGKADQLIRRVAATLTVDPPAPEVEPASDADEERAAAELAERILRAEGAPGARDDAGMLRGAIDLAGTVASVFRYTYVHPQACLKPVEIQAHPAATTVDDALVVIDPFTGAPTPADPATLTTRYVRADDTLTDTPAEARLGWEPKVCEVELAPAQVRPFPALVTGDVSTWPGALIGELLPLSEVVARFYGGERPSEDVCKQLAQWAPDGVDRTAWVPRAQRELVGAGTPTRPDGTVADEALCPILTLYLKSGPLAPRGAYVVVGGPREPIVREAWRAPVGDGPGARMEYLPVPLAQMRWREDTAQGDPYGVSGMEDLGPLEEMRATGLKFILDYVYRFGAPQVYLPFGTTVQPGQLAKRDGTPIYVDPNGRPFYEELPPLSPVVSAFYEMMGAELNTASGLEDAAQGVSSGNVKSGAHARQIIEQALVALSGTLQNANKFICRVWSLRLTFMRAFYATPRLLQAAGEGGDYQVRAWVGADLMGAGDIRIARGTGTMMPASAKRMMAQEDLQLAMQVGDTSAVQRYYQTLTGKTSPVLGLQDDPIRQRVTRQLVLWRQAAKAQHPPPPPPMGMDELGQMVPAPDPVAEAAARLFTPNPTDELPTVAPLRLQALADAMAQQAFAEADPRYQQALVAEYERMRQAAGVLTLAEQQQMQAQQAQAQQQLMLEQKESADAEQAARTAYAETEGGPAAQRIALQNAVEQSMRSAPTPDPMEYS